MQSAFNTHIIPTKLLITATLATWQPLRVHLSLQQTLIYQLKTSQIIHYARNKNTRRKVKGISTYNQISLHSQKRAHTHTTNPARTNLIKITKSGNNI